MDLNTSSSSDYLSYKKSKMNPNRVKRVEKRNEKIKRIIKLSVLTFCVIFLCVVVFIKKYAKRVDIEYGRHGLSNVENAEEQTFGEGYDADKRSIDKRLTLIQEEENAPSESRVLDKDKDKNEVMNFEQFTRLKEESYTDDLSEEERPVKQIAPEEPKPVQKSAKTAEAQNANTPKLLPKMQSENSATSLSVTQNGDFTPVEAVPQTSIKVLVGKYPSFEDAKLGQNNMKTKARVAPFIRKVGSTYSLQIGSYSNMDVARSVAGNYAAMGFDVWIYQQ